MIDSRRELSKCIEYEKSKYFTNGYFKEYLQRTNDYYIWQYQKALRYCEYYYNIMKHGKKYAKIALLIWRRKRNSIGRRIQIDIHENCFEQGLRIYHPGVVVNPNARIGKDAIVVGNLCIGNVSGKNSAATIGDNCMFGYGTIIMGKIHIASHVCLGGGTVVVHAVEHDGATIVGVPGHEILK